MSLEYRTCALTLACWATLSSFARSHDIWIEPNCSLVRVGEPVVLNFKLGNCNQGKTDGKTQGQLPQENVRAVACPPSDQHLDLTSRLVSSSTTSESGYWSTTISPQESGCYWLIQSLEDEITHDGRVVLGKMVAKAPLVTSSKLDDVSLDYQAVAYSLPIEFVLLSSPLPSIESKAEIKVKLLLYGQPQEDFEIAFTQPLAVDANQSVDVQLIQTDAEGIASWVPSRAGPVIISYSMLDESKKGNNFEATYYSTTLFLSISNGILERPAVAADPSAVQVQK